MDAIVIAGGIPLPEDALYPHTGGRPKALIDVAGKPMVQWVLDALSAAAQVDNVIITGLVAKTALQCSKPLYYLESQGQVLADIAAAVEKVIELNPQAEYVLMASSDIPGLTGEMVSWLIEQVEETPADVYYGVVPRAVMEKRYPGSRRTWAHLKDMDVCGGDINVIHIRMIAERLDVWEALIGNRKSPLKQAAAIGYGTLFQFLFRWLTVEEAAARISRRLGIRIKGLVWPWAEAGMDVDKPHQLEIMRADLSKNR